MASIPPITADSLSASFRQQLALTPSQPRKPHRGCSRRLAINTNLALQFARTSPREAVHTQDEEGNTPLLQFVKQSLLDSPAKKTAAYFFSAGADPSHQNRAGKTVFQLIEGNLFQESKIDDFIKIALSHLKRWTTQMKADLTPHISKDLANLVVDFVGSERSLPGVPAAESQGKEISTASAQPEEEKESLPAPVTLRGAWHSRRS